MKTPLYEHHLALGAKIVPFAGWEMPLQYKGILAEHQTVRQAVGLFDVSHMGRIKIKGEDAENFIDFLSTNQIKGKPSGSATYTVLCHVHGGSVDDVIVYKEDEANFFMIANASNREKDFLHFKAQAEVNEFHIEIEEVFHQEGIISLQGPHAFPLLHSLIPEIATLKPMHFLTIKEPQECIISRTGYTGAGGYELFGSSEIIVKWWETLLNKGKDYDIQPIGLGARDTLRLEMGFALYGHELSDSIAPNESVSAWTVKWDKDHFLGKEALEKLNLSSTKRSAYGIRLLDRGIPRQGCPVLMEGEMIGEVTSGSFSPTLDQGIALILVTNHLQTGDKVMIKIRQTDYHAQVVDLPFVRKTA